MRPLVAILGLASLGACLSLDQSNHPDAGLMPSWQEFDEYLRTQGQTNNRFKRDFPYEYFSEARGFQPDSGSSLASTLDSLKADLTDVNRQGLVANALDTVSDRLRQKDYIGAISQFADRLRLKRNDPKQDLLFDVPQTSVPQIIVDLAAFGPVITFGYAFARDQMMVDDMNELKDRIKVMTDTDINALKSSFSTLCSKVTEVTSVQGCDATPTCADEIENPSWFVKGSDWINKMLAITDPTCSS